jgi:putative ABC transport system substrate-binding protein
LSLTFRSQFPYLIFKIASQNCREGFMRRRDFIKAIGGTAAWPLSARAQQPTKLRRIGVLMPFAAGNAEARSYLSAFQQALRELGWIEGRNLAVETRFAEELNRLPNLAMELVTANVDVLVTEGTQPSQAARKATSSIPIVMARIGDAVGAGLVSSLAHPGGNVTGMSLMATEQGSKRLELLKEMLPTLSRVAVLSNPKNASQILQIKEMEAAAPVLKIEFQSVPVTNAADLEKYIRDAAHGGAQAFVTLDDALIQSLERRIVELATQQRLPVMGEFKSSADDGALMSYSANIIAMWRRAAIYVDKILKGAKPDDLPVELPTRFQLVINLKTAKAIGLTVPPLMLTRADEVIE